MLRYICMCSVYKRKHTIFIDSLYHFINITDSSQVKPFDLWQLRHG